MVGNDLFSQDLFEGKGNTQYCVIDNGKKTWIVPVKNMKYGFGILQSSNIKGKLVKNVLPVLKWSKSVRKFAKCEIKTLSLKNEVTQMIEEYCPNQCQYSVYYGNLDESPQNKKATIQVFSKDKTYAYVKITNEDIVKESFEREKKALIFLKEKGIVHVPEYIGINEVREWSAFVQSTVNEKNSSCCSFSEAHWKFLIDLLEKTKSNGTFKTSDMYENCIYLADYISNNKNFCGEQTISRAIKKVLKNIDSECGFYTFAHGDFTPKNTCKAEGQLYAFDFEYCLDKAVPFFDFFHYICQKNIMFNNMNIKKTLRDYQKYKLRISQYISEPDYAFMAYLLYIIAFYLKRVEGISGLQSGQLNYRVELLRRLLEEV
jgi:hypothetical protein